MPAQPELLRGCRTQIQDRFKVRYISGFFIVVLRFNGGIEKVAGWHLLRLIVLSWWQLPYKQVFPVFLAQTQVGDNAAVHRTVAPGFDAPAKPALVSDPLLAHKKAIPKWEWLFCDCPQVLLSACPPRISQGKECVQGKPLPGFPCAFNQRAAVGGPDFCSAKISSTKREPPFGWLSFVTVHRFCGLGISSFCLAFLLTYPLNLVSRVPFFS